MKSFHAPVWSLDGVSARRFPPLWLIVLAIVSLAAWQAAEYMVAAWPHPRAAELRAAARLAQTAQAEIARAKVARKLLQPAELDPNRTGLIGPDWSETTTTIGDVQAKRTATNPDLAAAIARALLALNPPPGAPVGVIASGSFVGANVAALSAIESLGLRPVIVSSLGSSMYGASDPEFGWLDMEAAVRKAGIWRAPTVAVVLGGESAIGESLTPAGRDMLVAAARRNGHEPIVAADLNDLKRSVMQAMTQATAGEMVALINAGGAVLGIGTCLDAYRLPSGLITRKPPCEGGVTGLVHDFAARNVPVLHLLNVRRLALDWGLPYDPVPLPPLGQNSRVYGRMPLAQDIK